MNRWKLIVCINWPIDYEVVKVAYVAQALEEA